MVKKLQLIVLFVLCLSVGLFAQTVILSDQFDAGDGKWNSGWIEGSTDVAFSIDTNSVLSGKNSYLADITSASATTYFIQRNANAPLLAGNVYTLSFMAVTDKEGASLNVLFEISGDPYTKRLNVIEPIATTPTVYTYKVVATEDVETNQVKLHYGGTQNDGAKIWIDSVVVVEEPDLALVDNWGKTAQGTAWPVDTTKTAGEAGLGDGAVPTGWATIRGAFATLEATTTEAVVVSGKLEYVGGGGGDAYTHLRYAITYMNPDSVELRYQHTDSAMWVSIADSAKNQNKHWGYGFHPRSGTGTISNGNGGQGTEWTINNGSWNSTWGNNGGPISTVLQTPRNAEMVAGVYDFAISVHVINDSTNEVRWSLVDQNGTKYWFAGAAAAKTTTTQFNGVCFGFNSDGTYTNVKFSNVRAELSNPIEIPDPIWEAYYVDEWGTTSSGAAWPMKNDTSTAVGSGLLGDGDVPGGWATIQGGFGQDISISTDEAIIVSGELEYVGGGGGSAYTHLRYALTYSDSLELRYQYTDSAKWVSIADSAKNQNKHSGYGFHPRSGTGTISNGNGGQGTVWSINRGTWNSTWGNNGGPLASVLQAPRNAEMVAGVYDWAISVQAVDDTTNEVRWYLLEKGQKYWFGGSVITKATTQVFNGVEFGFNDGTYTDAHITYCEVDLGDPITVPEAPWEPYYVDQWGTTSSGAAWPMKNDTSTAVGSGLLGDGDVPGGWATIQGGFGQDLTATTDRAVIVSGELEYVGGGGGSAYTHLRYALTYSDSLELRYQYTDSAKWVSIADSAKNQNKHTGYGFHPRSGTGTISNGNGGQGTVWSINRGTWNSTWGNNGGPLATVLQAPRNAEMVAGVYDWAISVQAVNDTTNEVRWYLVEKSEKYWYGGSIVTKATSQVFNGVEFGFNDGTYTDVHITYCEVDLGDPITVPPAPWEDYYLDEWGFIGDRTGGWTNETEDIVGHIALSGAAAPSDWAAVRGGFYLPVDLSDGYAYIVEGEMTLTGGGFEDAGSLRMGLFYGDAGTVAIDSALDSSFVWTGSESASGYLFLPHSGTNTSPDWSGTAATSGAVSDTTWLFTDTGTGYALLDKKQIPLDAVAGAGTYNFRMGVQLLGDGTMDVAMHIDSGDDYIWETRVIDANDPLVTSMINSICIAIDNSTTTAMNLEYVELSRADDLGGVTSINVERVGEGFPTTFSLSQNYPNPFNPSTTIKFGITEQSDVKLVVYDVLGRVVSELSNKKMNAGWHEVTFNASRFASGVYFYRIEAGDFVKVKKMMLLK
ncbi:MAG: T9SS type A sorting domain-containing protein [Calditrichaceae bacterium]|nr:T9SS type A sorting domain-containing protein [Calditrichaceae bacterium]